MVLFEHLLIEPICFHCIIVEHILECLVWWHSLSYVGYYLTLGHTPILEFIRSFTDFLTTWSISLSLRVIILGHTPFSALTLGHTPILKFIRSFADFLTTQSISWSLRVVILGHTPFSVLLLGHPPFFEFITSHVDFMVIRSICRSLQVIT